MKVGLRGRVGADSEVVVGKSLEARSSERALLRFPLPMCLRITILPGPRAPYRAWTRLPLFIRYCHHRALHTPSLQSQSRQNTICSCISPRSTPLRRPGLFDVSLLLYLRRVARIDEVFQPRRLAVNINDGHAVVCIGVL